MNEKVYREYDQAALDLQYDNQANVPDARRHLEWYPRTSSAVRERVQHDAAISYGPLPDQKLDIFSPPSDAGGLRPVVVFIHGGAWKALGREGSSFPADTVTRRGALYVALGFSIMPAAGNLDEMVAQVRGGIAWLHANVSRWGGDPERLHLVGHSSGAHLAGMAAVTDWEAAYALPEETIRSVTLLSGMYDLQPVRLSYRNQMLRLDRAAEWRNSPIRNLPRQGRPLLVAYGQRETAEFKRQAQAMHEHWDRRFGNSRILELGGLNHYEVAEELANPACELVDRIFDYIGM